MKAAIELDIFQEMKLEENTGEICLLYTSDAADEGLGVDLGGRRIITLARHNLTCLLYTSPSPRDGLLSRMPSSA